MIPHDALINALLSLDYHYKGQSDRTLLYKKKGSTNRVNVRRISLHDEKAARILLQQAGMDREEVEKFIAAYRCSQH
jgi:hypothetical protein